MWIFWYFFVAMNCIHNHAINLRIKIVLLLQIQRFNTFFWDYEIIYAIFPLMFNWQRNLILFVILVLISTYIFIQYVWIVRKLWVGYWKFVVNVCILPKWNFLRKLVKIYFLLLLLFHVFGKIFLYLLVLYKFVVKELFLEPHSRRVFHVRNKKSI